MQIRKRGKKANKRNPFADGEVMRRGIFVLPSLVTTGSLFFGFMSIIHTFNGQFHDAAVAIMIAAVFDFLDGTVARLTKTQTAFGEQYDSLTDCVSFGLAPALLAFSWALEPFGRVGWLAAFCYFACAALRLARFNVQSQSVEKHHFQGLPTPGAAGTLASWVFFHDVLLQNDLSTPDAKHFSVVLAVFGLALLMVSNFRYRNLKRFSLKDRHPFTYLVLAVFFLITIASEPRFFLFPMVLLYAAHGPLESILFKKKEKERGASRTAKGETAPVFTKPENRPEEVH